MVPPLETPVLAKDMTHAFPAVPGFDQTLLHKFTARIDAGDWAAGRCWNWTGYKTAKGYGVFAPAKKVHYRAHRFAIEAYLGRQPTSMVLHSCDNPSCVNPLHLAEGSHAENMQQMAERKRAARGVLHHKAKLTHTKAVSITILHRGRDFSTYELAEMFGVHQSTVSAIINGNLWPDAYTDALMIERERGE